MYGIICKDQQLKQQYYDIQTQGTALLIPDGKKIFSSGFVYSEAKVFPWMIGAMLWLT